MPIRRQRKKEAVGLRTASFYVDCRSFTQISSQTSYIYLTGSPRAGSYKSLACASSYRLLACVGPYKPLACASPCYTERRTVRAGFRIRTLFRTTAKVAVLWMTAAQRGLIFPKAPRSMAAELTTMVAVKF